MSARRAAPWSIALPLIGALLCLLALAPAAGAQSGDLDCSDFASQAEAQMGCDCDRGAGWS